jgi:hypothetical protein
MMDGMMMCPACLLGGLLLVAILAGVIVLIMRQRRGTST